MTKNRKTNDKAGCKNDKAWTKTVAQVMIFLKHLFDLLTLCLKKRLPNLTQSGSNLLCIMCPWANPEFQQYWLAISPQNIKISALHTIFFPIWNIRDSAQLNYHLLISLWTVILFIVSIFSICFIPLLTLLLVWYPVHWVLPSAWYLAVSAMD